MQEIKFSFFEDSEENKIIFFGAKDSILDINYPDRYISNNAGHNYARLLWITYASGVNSATKIHIHENFLVNLFNNDEALSEKNSTIQVNLDCIAENGRVIPRSINATCEALKVNRDGTKDTNHSVFITESPYSDGTGNTKYGIGVWVQIEGYQYIETKTLYSADATSVPIHKNHLSSYYIAEYLTNDAKVTDVNMVNLLSLLSPIQIGYGMYDTDLAQAELNSVKTRLAKVPMDYIQNTVYFSNTYAIGAINVDEKINPYSISGTEKITILDSVNGAFKVSQNGTYAVQLHNGFGATGGNTHLSLNVYKNSSVIRELNIESYLENGKENSSVSNIAILHLVRSDAISLKALWSVKNNIVLSNNTFITIHPIQFD